MPKGNIRTSADKATSGYRSNPTKKTLDKMVKETSKRIPTSVTTKRVTYKAGKSNSPRGY
jgi:hypothetical protein